ANTSLDAPVSTSTSYRYGQPVIGARATPSTVFSKTASAVAITMSPTSVSEPVLTGLNGTNYSRSGGLWNVPAGGSCFSTADNQFLFMDSVKFGEDTFSGCTLNLSQFVDLLGDPESGASWCTRLQNLLWNVLYNSVGQTGNTDEQEPIRYANLPPDHLAAWPSAQTNVTGNWVPIQNVFMASPPNDPISRVGICVGMLLGQDTEVQFSRFGSITNPQYHIVGAKATQIYGDIVMGPTLPTVEITVRVRFTDVTQPARVVEKSRPLLLAELPSDFFYPFF
ncbi:Tectonic-1, partial [Paragonimus westermani]